MLTLFVIGLLKLDQDEYELFAVLLHYGDFAVAVVLIAAGSFCLNILVGWRA